MQTRNAKPNAKPKCKTTQAKPCALFDFGFTLLANCFLDSTGTLLLVFPSNTAPAKNQTG
jgi:hypothetical protein